MSLLPKNLQDDSFLALEECIKYALKIDNKAFMPSVVDYLLDNILFFLAEQFHILNEGWADCETRESKIELLKKAVYLHKKKGTIGAVEDLLEAFGARCKVWKDYGGIPHHFMVSADFLDKGTDFYEAAERLVNRLNSVKQLRAKLDEIIFSAGVQKSINTACAVLAGEIIEVRF